MRRTKRYDRSQFPPLDVNAPQIRVLLLYHGKEEQQILCEHEVVSLEKPGEFEALSYCWGPRDNAQEAILNGTPFRVSPALKIALRHLRRADSSRRLWIDAICIDQGQHEEKIHQIRQMRSVYESASQVLVWLGPALKNSAAGFDLIEAIATRPSWVEGTGEIVSPDIELPLNSVDGILELMRRPYWHRMWIIQEIAVASKDPIVGCGDRELPTADAHKKHGKHHQLQDFASKRFLPEHYFDIANIRMAIQSEAADIPQSLPDLYSNRPWTNLLELLAETRTKFSGDSRGRIYSILGLMRWKVKQCSKFDHSLSPDYTKTPWRVYREATKLAMELEEMLEVLQYKNHLNCPELPSWVPDFSLHKSQTFPKLGPDHWHDWSASGRLRTPGEVRFRTSLDLETLYAAGTSIDSIERVVDLQKVDTAIEDVIRDVHNAVFNSVASDSDPEFSSSKYLVDAVWRSLIGNRSAENDLPANAGFHNLYLALVGQHPTLSVLERRKSKSNLRPFTDSVSLAVRSSRASPHRTFIISKTGFLGLGTPDCQQGDSICILYGYKMPVILRPLGNCHQLLGSAYVHGIMHGEGIPSLEQCEKASKTFTII